MKIMPNRMDRTFLMYQQEIENKALQVLRSGWYILGQEVNDFEIEFAKYLCSNNCVGLASGLDALWIALRILGIKDGDEIIVQGNAYIACVMGITINGAKPVFVEPDEFYNIDTSKIEEKITNRTKAILVVHLFGQTANMTEIMRIANQHKLMVVEDCAQSHGAKWRGIMSGTIGDVGCFSFYPSKNLGAYGDGGAVVTNNSNLANQFRVFRNYGSEKRYFNQVVGTNSRLDEIQAGMLRIKLNYLDILNEERVRLCERYLNEINNPFIKLPLVREGATSVWHQFVIRSQHRDKLIRYLNKYEIGSIIHYPIPPHLSEAYRYLGLGVGSLPITEKYADEVLSLPLYNCMSNDEQDFVISKINSFNPVL